ncbi:MAG: hypothetical protein IH984_09530 [Planctomycetes bacterium]|nr:hypothetical protein [Planctomycetota bacterium]
MNDTPDKQELKETESMIADMWDEVDSLENEQIDEFQEWELVKIRLYILTEHLINTVGVKNALGLIVNTEGFDQEESKKLYQDHTDLIIAIDQGMSLNDFLCVVNPRSWVYTDSLKRIEKLEDPLSKYADIVSLINLCGLQPRVG